MPPEDGRHIEVRWNARADPPAWVVRVHGTWRPVVAEWAAESRHRGLARPHLEQLARASYGSHAGLPWSDVAMMWVVASYDREDQ